jgi:Rieske Fe-S protein
VSGLNDIGIGEVKLFSYPTVQDPCIMIRTGSDKVVAYSQKCTHLSCAVYFAKEQNRFECPCHEGYFSVEDGSVLQGPPPRPLPRITLKFEGNNIIATGVEV